jgi:hypothetical protein
MFKVRPHCFPGFLEVDVVIAVAANWFDRSARFLQNSELAKPILNQVEGIPPAEFFALF